MSILDQPKSTINAAKPTQLWEQSNTAIYYHTFEDIAIRYFADNLWLWKQDGDVCIVRRQDIADDGWHRS